MADPKQQSSMGLSARNYFLPYQWAWIRDESQQKIYPKSRRCGVTYATSYRCVTKCLRQSRGTDFVQWVSSRDLGLAREFVTVYVRRWCRVLNVLAKGIDPNAMDVIDMDRDVRAFQVTFPNGARIMSLSSNPNAFAGKGGDILLDEVDLHDDSGVLIDMALPCIDWGGQIEMVSAYDADGSSETPFAVMVDEIQNAGNPGGWSMHQTTIEDAVKAGLVEKINESRARRKPEPLPPQTPDEFIAKQRAKCRTEDAWLSQYMCVPCNAAGRKAVSLSDLNDAKEDYGILRIHLEGNAARGDKIDPCVQELLDRNIWRELADEYGHAGYRFGYDVARTTDLAAIWVDVLEGPNAAARCVAVITLKNCKFASQEDLLRQAYRNLGIRGCGDSTGNGMQVCERLEDAYNPTHTADPAMQRFIGVNFSASKSTLGTLLTEAFEKQLQIIPADCREVALDIMCIEKALSVNKKMTYTERQNRLLPDSHADIGWACALAKMARNVMGTGGGPVRGEVPERSGVWQEAPGRRTDTLTDYPDHSDDERQHEEAFAY